MNNFRRELVIGSDGTITPNPGSCPHSVMAVSISALSRADADTMLTEKPGAAASSKASMRLCVPLSGFIKIGNVGDLRRNLLEHPKQFRAEARFHHRKARHI